MPQAQNPARKTVLVSRSCTPLPGSDGSVRVATVSAAMLKVCPANGWVLRCGATGVRVSGGGLGAGGGGWVGGGRGAGGRTAAHGSDRSRPLTRTPDL